MKNPDIDISAGDPSGRWEHESAVKESGRGALPGLKRGVERLREARISGVWVAFEPDPAFNGEVDRPVHHQDGHRPAEPHGPGLSRGDDFVDRSRAPLLVVVQQPPGQLQGALDALELSVAFVKAATPGAP